MIRGMIFTLRFVFLGLFFLQGLQAQGFIWKVKDKPIYIAGTIHLLKETDYPLPATYEEAYKAAKEVYFETDLPTVQQKTSAAALMKAGMLEKGQTLSGLISKEKIDSLKKITKELKMKWGPFELMKPWMVSMMISVAQLKKLGYDPQKGVDLYFYDRTKNDRKPIAALESFEDQLKALKALDTIPLEMSEQMIRELQQTPEMMQKLTAVWKKGDHATFEKMTIQEIKKISGDLLIYLLLDRNYRWLPKVQKVIEEGKPTLILVGSAHLVGEESLIDLLQKRSVVLEPMTVPASAPTTAPTPAAAP